MPYATTMTGRFREHERTVLNILLSNESFPEDLRDALIADVHDFSLDVTGVGYFLELDHPDLPVNRAVMTEPLVMGRTGDHICGFIIFLGDRGLTLECHGYGDPLPDDLRDRDIVVGVWDDFLGR